MLRDYCQHAYARRILTSLTWCGFVLIGILVILIVTVGAVLGTERGRLWITDLAVQKVNQSTDFVISLGHVKTPSLGEWRVPHLRILRQGETWLEATNIILRWQPRALLKKHINVQSVNADTLQFYNLAIPKNTKSNTDQQAPSNLGEIKLPKVVIVNISVKRAELYGFAQADSDQAIPAFHLNAKLNSITAEPIALHAVLTTLNEAPTHISLKASAKTTSSIRVEGNVTEPVSGYIGSVLDIPKDQPIDARFNINAKRENNRYIIDLDTLQLPIANREIVGEARLIVSTDFQQGELQPLRLLVDDTEHTIQATWNPDGISGKATLSRFPLDLLSPWTLPINSGELSADLILDGTPTKPGVTGTLALTTEYKTRPIDVNFNGSANQDLIDIKSLKGQIDKTTINIKGKVDLHSDQSAVTAAVTNADLDTLGIFFGLSLPEGLSAQIISADASLKGKITNPNGSISAKVNGTYQGEPLTLSSQATKLGNLVTINTARLGLSEGIVNVSGTVDINTLNSDLQVDARALPLTLASLVGVKLPVGLEGKATLAAHIRNNLRDPYISGNANLNGEYQSIPFSFEAKATRDKKNIIIKSIDMSANNEAMLNADGAVNDTGFTVHLQANRLPTALLSALNINIQAGEFNADIRASGSMTEPTLNGEINYQSILVGYTPDGDKKNIDFNWNLAIDTQKNDSEDQDNLILNSTFTWDDQPPVNLAVNIPLKPYLDLLTPQQKSAADDNGMPLSALIKGQLNLQTLSFLLDPELHRLTGKVDMDMQISGTTRSPNINGMLYLIDAYYQNTISGTIVNNIECSIEAMETIFDFSRCSANDGNSGTYELVGKVNLPLDKKPGLVDLQLKTKKANIVQRKDIQSEATGQLNLLGDFDSFLAKGVLDISPLTAVIDSQLTSGIPKIEIERVASFGEPDKNNNVVQSLAPEVKLDILIKANQQAFLRGRGLEAELGGQIHLRGKAKKPLYEGEFQTIRGVFEVFGKKFDLERGQVNLANNAIGIAITGVYENKDQRIIANISGTNDNLNIKLSAIPDMPEDEILAFIIFGKSVQTITPFEAIQLASAVQTLRGGGSGAIDPIGSARDILGVDTLSVETETTAAGETGLNVGVGKYLNEKVYLELQRTPNPAQPWKGSIEIELTPRIHLESSTGTERGIEGAKIKWKNDY